MEKSAGREPTQRRLHLVDLVILVLATAIGLVAIRQDLEALFTRPEEGLLHPDFYPWTNPLILSKAVTVEIWLMAWTTGWLIVQLRQPRLRLRQLSRQPGFVARFSAVVITLVFGPLTWTLIRSITRGTNSWLNRLAFGDLVSSQIGAAVLAGWALLVASGRCRIRAGWLDRVGQVIGLIRVAMIPANLLHFFRWTLENGGWANYSLTRVHQAAEQPLSSQPSVTRDAQSNRQFPWRQAMTPEALFDKLTALADLVVADPRWENEKDELGVAVLGMLLYGYGLGTGRLVMMLDIEDINDAVLRCLVERVGVAAKWGSGLDEDAANSAFNKEYHPGQRELIGVGHQYIGEGKLGKMVGNVFANIESVRRRAEA